ncbi:hypothetical protein COI13_07245 [Neisseria meningitidis]|uniref:Uncharacterized protein n=1 Tax=Neisseria meningitidis TaxID=487 RepID=A0A425AIU2_NEIME|nr:hypothetical protein BVD88_00695 [Neisseria meningitidis]QEN77573.1 hypothetical protein CCD83_09375 [Neisseria meningitidis]RNK13715.1 hypothetical protein COI24_02255 [Neisseria meningitidis]RPB91012.1 hypothetical protein JY18_09980 [Neisseria meningitidis]RPC48179.1 hypothetical protein JY50_04065 [Neisseria meningitidis]
MLLKNKCRLKTFQTAFFYQSSHIFYQGCKIYPKQQKPPCRHSRKSGNLEPNTAKIYPKRQQSFHRHSRAGGNLERKI